jgi:hypothetical protein
VALDPSLTYPGQIDITDLVGYPKGRAKNVTSIGDGTGTPLEQGWVSDLFGMQQALLTFAGITPTNVPDKVGASQYLDAIKAVCRREQQKAQAQNWPERATATSGSLSTLPNGNIGLAWSPSVSTGRYVMIAPSSSSGCSAWSSDDGTQWESAGLQTAAAALNPCVASGLINGTPGFLMTWAGSGGLYTTTTGLSWGSVSATVPAQGVACYSDSLALWVIAGDLGQIYTSPTTLAGSWTARTTPAGWQASSGGAKRVVFANGLFVVLPLASYNKCLTSSDGIIWVERTLPVTGVWSGLAYSTYDGIWMAGNLTTGPMVTSVDGFTWATTASALMYLGNDLAAIGPLWVMPTLIANGGGFVWSVDKGANWNRGPAVGNHRVATAGWKRIIATNDRFVVAHADGVSVEVALSQRAS